MQTRISTTPFGRRMLTIAHVAAQAKAKSRPMDRAVHKWQVFRDICEAKSRLGVSERSLTVLDALLSFHPETVLTGEGLIVFPSNEQLGLRAHGMAPATLRRHLAALVEAGIIIRRDSPNGKRYARKGRAGDIEKAFGFDLSAIVARAEEFSSRAEEVRAANRALKYAKERITLCRRDIAKMIATGIEEGVAVPPKTSGPQDWPALYALFRSIIERLPRVASLAELEAAADELSLLAEEIGSFLEDHVNSQNKSAKESHSERHKQNSNSKSPIELEPRQPSNEAASSPTTIIEPKVAMFPLGMVLDACPDLLDYARNGITNWRDFLATAAVIRPMLGISPSAWEDAVDAMGEQHAAIVVACVLQRSEGITSAGGYLRDLTRRKREGEFTIGPMVMALLSGKRRKERLRA